MRGRLVLPGMIDTHAHVFRYVSGRFGLDADMVGVHSGGDNAGGPGRPLGADLPRVPGIRGTAGGQPCAGLHLRLHGRWPGGPLLSRTLPAGLHRDRGHGARRARERRPGARRERPCGNRRLHPLGQRGDAPRRDDRARARHAIVYPFRPALAAAGGHGVVRPGRHPAGDAGHPAPGRRSGASVHPPSWRLRRSPWQAASSGA